MATIPVIALNAITGNTTNSNWSPLSLRRISLLDSTNPLFPRQIILDNSGLICTRPSQEPVQLPMTAFLSAVGAANPNLTWAPICTMQPGNSTVANSVATGFVSAFSAETAISYRWQESINAGTNWTNLSDSGVFSNTATNTLNISNTNTLNGTYYRVQAYNTTGLSVSNLALLSVLTDPSIVQQPLSLIVTHPSGASFTVSAVGASSLTYQWELSTNGGSSWSNISNAGVYSGATTVTLVISVSTGLNSNQYRCVATDSNGTATSNAAILTVN